MDDGSQPAQAQGSRFYALPTDQAVEAGAQRGPAPLSGSEAQSLDDAALLGTEDSSSPPDPPAVESGSDIRLDTLLIEGLPITQLSTSRLFAYLTHYGAQPLGLEWIDDQRCKVVFADERSARLGLEYLCSSPSTSTDAADNTEMQDAESTEVTPLPNIDTLLEYDPDSWHSEFITSLVQPRKAHRIPAKLYNHVERQAAITELEERKRTADAVSSLPDDVPEIYREMEEADRKAASQTREVRDLQKLRSTLWLRHAVTNVDRKESRASTKSQWYKRHGYEAGREIVPKLLQVGEVRESVELFPDYKPSESRGDGRRNDREDKRSRIEQLDSELEGYLAGRNGEEPERKAGEMMADAVQARQSHRRSRRDEEGDLMDRLGSRSSRRRHGDSTPEGRWGHDAYDELQSESSSRRSHGRGRRSRGGRDELDAMDEELEDIRRQRSHQHQRELSPGRGPRGDDGRVKVKGRGRMKAPGLSNFDDDKESLASRLNGGNLLGRMGGRDLADRFS